MQSVASYVARVVSVDTLVGNVKRIRLDIEAPSALTFAAGQYLKVLHPDGTEIPFTIASCAESLPRLELHFEPLPASRAAAAMEALLQTQQRLTVLAPFGDVTVDAPLSNPLLMIVSGTGAAQAAAILCHLRHSVPSMSVTLVWSVAATQRFYCAADFEVLLGNDWFRYFPMAPVLADVPRSEVQIVCDWLARNDDACADTRVIICGAPEFVYGVTDAIEALSLTPASIEADAFSYAPRPVLASEVKKLPE